MATVPGDKPPGPPGNTGGKAGLGLRVWAKINGMSPEQYRHSEEVIAEYKKRLPRPTTTDELNEASLRL
jgi:hypothetical protein